MGLRTWLRRRRRRKVIRRAAAAMDAEKNARKKEGK